jgi:DNA-directed RNA polymerase subunit RPC12/RpoP
MTEAYPRWVDVDGTCRCSDCGEFVDVTWRFYESPTTWTKALCYDCSSRLLREAKAAGA